MASQTNPIATDRSAGLPLDMPNAAISTSGSALRQRRASDVSQGILPDSASHAPELRALFDDLTDLVRAAPSDIRADLERRMTQARERLNLTLEQGREVRLRTLEQVQRSVEASREAVVHRPLSSVLMSTGVGVLIGFLLSARRR